MDGGQSFATEAPPPPRDYRERLAGLRRTGTGGINGLAWCSLVILFPLGMFVIHLGGFLGLIGVLEGTKYGPEMIMAYYTFGLIVLGGALGLGAMFLVRIWFRSMFTRWHAEIWQELHLTNLAVLVVDECYAGLIIGRLQDIYGIGWLSPSRPRRLEDQLEFAASYHLALRKLLWGIGRVDSNPLWLGSIANYAATYRGAACGCAAFMVLGVLGLAVWILGAILYLKRCAALTAYCDFLLQDDRDGEPAVPVT